MIHFSTEDTSMPAIDTIRIERWLRQVAAGYGFSLGEIHYIFCSDQRILQINKEFLGHDYFTDHIGFDYSSARTLNGDIYISLDTVASNALLFDNDTQAPSDIANMREFYRVLIHAILHLTGQNDKTPEEEAEMHHKEDLALALLH